MRGCLSLLEAELPALREAVAARRGAAANLQGMHLDAQVGWVGGWVVGRWQVVVSAEGNSHLHSGSNDRNDTGNAAGTQIPERDA